MLGALSKVHRMLRISRGKYVLFQHGSQFSQGSILYLPDPLLGYTNNLAHLFQRLGPRPRCLAIIVGIIADAKPLAYDRPFHIAKLGQVRAQYVPQLIDAIHLKTLTLDILIVAFLKDRIEFNRKSAAILAGLARRSGETLDNRPAGIGAELETPGTVELRDTADQGHIAFAYELGEVHTGQPCSLSHRKDQRHVGLDNL